jgi:hypothetical protein
MEPPEAGERLPAMCESTAGGSRFCAIGQTRIAALARDIPARHLDVPPTIFQPPLHRVAGLRAEAPKISRVMRDGFPGTEGAAGLDANGCAALETSRSIIRAAV